MNIHQCYTSLIQYAASNISASGPVSICRIRRKKVHRVHTVGKIDTFNEQCLLVTEDEFVVFFSLGHILPTQYSIVILLPRNTSKDGSSK